MTLEERLARPVSVATHSSTMCQEPVLADKLAFAFLPSTSEERGSDQSTQLKP